MYVRKTTDEYVLEYDYGYGHGKEVISRCSTYKEAEADRWAYMENEHIYPTIRKCRVRVSDR